MAQRLVAVQARPVAGGPNGCGPVPRTAVGKEKASQLEHFPSGPLRLRCRPAGRVLELRVSLYSKKGTNPLVLPATGCAARGPSRGIMFNDVHAMLLHWKEKLLLRLSAGILDPLACSGAAAAAPPQARWGNAQAVTENKDKVLCV
jgi:hypothetical protein